MTARMLSFDKWCPMCGAGPGEHCTIVSDDPERGRVKGTKREESHFYRGNDHPIAVLIPDEPPYKG